MVVRKLKKRKHQFRFCSTTIVFLREAYGKSLRSFLFYLFFYSYDMPLAAIEIKIRLPRGAVPIESTIPKRTYFPRGERPGMKAVVPRVDERIVALVNAPDSVGVYLLHQRLSGFPTWSPRFHRRVALHARTSRRAVVYDTLPVAPRSLGTASRLLSMQYVQGNVRERKVRWPLKYASARFLGYTSVTSDEITAFNKEWSLKSFHIVSNNCLAYADALSAFLLDGNMAGKLHDTTEGQRSAAVSLIYWQVKQWRVYRTATFFLAEDFQMYATCRMIRRDTQRSISRRFLSHAPTFRGVVRRIWGF